MAAEAPEPLIILGARSFAREVADLVMEMAAFTLMGFVENIDPARCRDRIAGLPVFWVDELPTLAAGAWGLCALGSTTRSAIIQRAERDGLRFATLIHPSARVSRTSAVREGTIISPGVQVASNTSIGRHVLINRGALIGHDVEIGDGLTIGPGANIAAGCRIGLGSYIAMGSVVLPAIAIGRGSVVAAGSVVTRDVPDHVMVAGMPARIIKRDVDGL
jgi:sugar O-acyltransferase (sialic acid O-acetyltransferase NeuD family)